MLFSSYWNFLARKPATDVIQRTGIEEYPYFFQESLLWSLFFSIIYAITSFSLKTLWPIWYKTLTPRKQKDFPSYVVCLIHHIVRVPNAWVHVLVDFMRSDTEAAVFNYVKFEAVVGPFCIGYFVSDLLWYAIPEAFRGEFEYLIHHIATLLIISSSIYEHAYLCRWIPHLLICDTTNMFFNTAWILRTVGFKDTVFVQCLEIMFAISFLFTRVINMPCFLFVVATSSYGSGLGYARIAFLPLGLLQWYWFSKIVSKLFNRMASKEQKDSKQC